MDIGRLRKGFLERTEQGKEREFQWSLQGQPGAGGARTEEPPHMQGDDTEVVRVECSYSESSSSWP